MKLPPGLSEADQRWIDGRMLWLVDQFGSAWIGEAEVVLLDADFFPETAGLRAQPYSSDEYWGFQESLARSLCTELCHYMRLDAARIQLEFFYDPTEHNAQPSRTTAGLYSQIGDKFLIEIDASNLEDQLALLAVLAHELAHVHLLGDERLSNDNADHEFVTDLLTVFLGLGVVSANAKIRETRWQAGAWAGYEMRAFGYFSMPMYGYALALFAELRNEQKPAWVNHLRSDVQAAFLASRKFLLCNGIPRDTASNETSFWDSYGQASMHATASIVHSEDQDHADATEESCNYCGASQVNENGICAACQKSIDQNQEEMVEGEAENPIGVWMLRAVILFIIVLFFGTLAYSVIFDRQ